jgi:hypothetical protein
LTGVVLFVLLTSIEKKKSMADNATATATTNTALLLLPSIPKEAHHHAIVKAERLMIDLSLLKTETIAKYLYWLLVMH